MKRQFLSLLLTMICGLAAIAQNAQKPWKYVNVNDLRVIGKGWEDTERDFSRLPVWLKDSVRPTLWDRQQCSTGIAVRFATDSRRVGIRYRLLWDTHMVHMADTGLKGTDLYIYEGDSVWRHANTNRPNADKDTKMCEALYLENLDGEMHEYMVYMPLYDGVEEMWIKVDSGAVITPGVPQLIDSNKKIVAYGTSIMQGGCASRTGMAATAIISRELNAEVINLGFSGEGKMDACMAHAMAQIPDVDVYLIDPVPNCTEMMCDTLTYDFIKTLRQGAPRARIVMVEGPMYPYSRYNSYFRDYLPKKNEAYRRNYEKLIADDPKNLYYVTCENLDGAEDDGTVDGIHLTDLGYRHYADKLLPVLRQALQTPDK